MATNSKLSSSRSSVKKRETLASLRSSLRRSEFLLNVTRRVARIEKLDELLFTLVEIVSSEMDAERGSLFLNDAATDELYSRVAQGTFNREIRLANNAGIAGSVFQSGKGEIVSDVSADPRFRRHLVAARPLLRQRQFVPLLRPADREDRHRLDAVRDLRGRRPAARRPVRGGLLRLRYRCG